MTKRHFERFAALVKADVDEAREQDNMELFHQAMYAAMTFSRVAIEDNPRFDHNRFMLACGLRPAMAKAV